MIARTVALLAVTAVAAAAGMVEVTGERLSAADLAAAVPAFAAAEGNADFGPAPAPGSVRAVSQAQLAAWARLAGVNAAPSEFPSDLRITRAVRVLSEPEATELIRKALASDLRVLPQDVEVELLAFGSPVVPTGPLQFDVDVLGKSLNQPTRIHLRWQPPGGRSQIEVLQATLRVRGSYLTSNNDLAAGSELAPSDVELHVGYLPDASDALRELPSGRIALRQPLSAGEPLTASAIRVLPEVERGDLLELRVQLGAVSLRAPARAEGAGSTGDVIACRNLQSGQRVSAVVIDRQTAEAIVR